MAMIKSLREICFAFTGCAWASNEIIGRVNVLLLCYPWVSWILGISYCVSLRMAIIPTIPVEFCGIVQEILHAAKHKDVYNTIRLLMENQHYLHVNCQHMPGIMRHVDLLRTIKSHGLFSQMIAKKDVCTFINELPHSYRFYMSGYVNQVWMPASIQARYHAGDVMLVKSSISEGHLLECKIAIQWQSSIPQYLKEHSHIKLSMGGYEAKVYYDFVEKCARMTPKKINFDELLFEGPKSFFLVQNMDHSYLKNFVKETSQLNVPSNFYSMSSFLEKLNLR